MMKTPMNAEQSRLAEAGTGTPWRKWGPYLSERQWGTVREDYSENGDAWNYLSDEPLVGSGDIQSLADLANGFEVVRTMRIAPITKRRIASPGWCDGRTGCAVIAHHDAARRLSEKVVRNIVVV